MSAATITVQEATRVSGLSRTAIFNLIKSGTLVSTKLRGRRLILVESLQDLSSATASLPDLLEEAAIAIGLIGAVGSGKTDFRPFLRSWLDLGGTIAVQEDALIMRLRGLQALG